MISSLFQKNKKRFRRLVSLLLVFVISVLAIPASAAEIGVTAPPPGTTFVDVGSLPPTLAVSPTPESGGHENSRENSGSSETGGSTSSEAWETPVPSPTPTPELAQEREDTGDALAAASRMLITGGHKPYMSGYAGNLFKPNKNMTRAEVAVALYNLLVAKQPVTESAFSDVSLNAWYGKEVNALHKAGILGGYSDGTFRPNKEITRAEFVTLLTACFPMKSGSVSFTDVSSDDWAYSAIASASAQGWIGGFGDGTFRPKNPLRRCDAAKILNIALDRTGDGFAADKNKQEFVDVPMDHWAFEHIAEAADPLEDTPSPTPSPSPSAPPSVEKGYAQVTATSGLNLRSGPSTDYNSLTVLPFGTVVTVLETAQSPWIQVKTSAGTTGYVHQDYIVNYEPGSAQNATLSTYNATVPQYKTLYLEGTVTPSGTLMQWKSSDESIATVDNGFVYGKAPGKVVITYTDLTGNSKATCNVTVSGPEAVRAAYTNPNVVSAGKEFKMLAVTDSSKTAVRFDVVAGGSGSWETSQFVTESQSAAGLPTNTVKIFERSVTFPIPGTYTLRAYSKTSGDYSTDYKEFTVLVVQDYDVNTTTTERRKASTEIIDIIASFEGFLPTVYPDRLAYNVPTVGYGYVVNVNTTFYNNLTKSEAKAILADHVNGGNYAGAVNTYRERYNLKMSQCQFDALVCFVYNCGSGVLLETSGSEPYYGTARMLLNSVVPPTSFPVSGTVNISNATVYSEPKASSAKVGTISTGSSVQVTGVQRNGKDNKEVWYQVSGSVSGWARAGNIKLSGSFTRDFAYTDAITFGNNLTQWNMAGGVHLPGLYNRRRAEARLFSYGDYAGCYYSSPDYDYNPGYDIPSWY